MGSALRDSLIVRRPMLSLSLGLVALVLMVRGIWGWHTQRLLDRELEAVRARGEPVRMRDLNREAIPDDLNAWPLLLQAANLTLQSGVDSPASSNAEYAGYPPFSVRWIRMAAASEQAHAQAFALARQARSRPQAQVRTTYPDSPSRFTFTSLNGARNLANVVGDGAIFQHLQGRDVEALERCLDLLHEAQSLRSEPMAISQLVAIGIEALAMSRIQAIAPGLRLGDPQVRAKTEELIQRLLDESDFRRGLREGILGERCYAVGMADELTAETWFLDPSARMQLVRMSQATDRLGLAAAAENAVVAANLLAGERPSNAAVEMGWTLFIGGARPSQIPRYSRWFPIDSLDVRYLETGFRVLSDRRMTAVLLAIQLYRHDHGRWPEKLDELVPAYLPALPADLFRDDQAPVGYVVLKSARPDGQDRPMLYVDHGPAEQAIADEPMIGWQSDPLRPRTRETHRQYRDVSRWMPAKLRRESWPGLTPVLRQQAVEGDPYVTDGPGEEAEAEE